MASARIRGFTLIELLVVIAIIGILSSVVITSLNSARAKARDATRQSDIREIQKAIELYATDHGNYPSTGSLDTVYVDPTCAVVTAPDVRTSDWVPGLVSGGYISRLPQDPLGKGADQARSGATGRVACYVYASNGTAYILSAWAVAETGPINTNSGLYSRAGIRESQFPDQRYLCNHPNIGNASYGDYYRYSYTVSEGLGCSW